MAQTFITRLSASTSAGNMTVIAPATATVGGTGTITLAAGFVI